jgi:hypothetical protein
LKGSTEIGERPDFFLFMSEYSSDSDNSEFSTNSNHREWLEQLIEIHSENVNVLKEEIAALEDEIRLKWGEFDEMQEFAEEMEERIK